MWRTIGKWWWYPALMVAVMLLAALPWAMGHPSDDTAQPTDDFTVATFDADYTIVAGPDGRTDVRVVETLAVVFHRPATNHGIVRLIPLRYQQHDNTVTDVSVTGTVITSSPWNSSDRPTIPPYTGSVVDRVYAIRIGDPSEYVKSGVRQTYVITYVLGDVAMNSFDRTRQEIYLDANGTGWKQAFGAVTARLHVPNELVPRLDGAAACYAGAEGSRTPCSITRSEDRTTFTASATDLQAKETLTFAVGFTPGTFPVAYTPVPDWAIWANGRWWILILPAVGLLAYLGVSLQRLWYTRSERPDVIAVAFQPPKDVPVFAAADLLGVSAKAPAATLLDLVVRRLARIVTTDEAGIPQLATTPGRALGWWQQRKLRRALTLEVPELPDEAWADESARGVVQFMFPPGRHPLDRHLSGSEAGDAASARATYVERRGWRQAAPGGPTWFIPLLIVMLLGGGVIVLAGAAPRPEYRLGIALAVVGVLLVIAAVYRRPTQGRLTAAGEKVRRELLGLREFVTMAEADRIAWLQSAASAPRVQAMDAATIVSLYEPLLPYALIFGVEKTWSQLIGDHVQRLPDDSGLESVVAGLGMSHLSYGDVIDTVSRSQPYQRWTSAESTYGGGGVFDSINGGVGQGFSDVGSLIDDLSRGSNDGGGSSSGGSSWSSSSSSSDSSWSSGGSSGGGSSGGGMGGGGGDGW